MDSDARKGPIAKSRSGRFQVTFWDTKVTIKAKNAFDIEREVDTVRACVQHSRFNRESETWENNSIWCNPRELGDLAEALEGLRDKQNGTESAPTEDLECGREES